MNSKTLRTACNEYLTHLEENGQTPGTVKTSRRILDLLVSDMGENKELGKILSVHVDKFYKSAAATTMTTKTGEVKSRAARSALQIRRVVRMALVWFHAQGWVERVPLPADEKRFLEAKPIKKTGKAEHDEEAVKTTGDDEVEPAEEQGDKASDDIDVSDADTLTEE